MHDSFMHKLVINGFRNSSEIKFAVGNSYKCMKIRQFSVPFLVCTYTGNSFSSSIGSAAVERIP